MRLMAVQTSLIVGYGFVLPREWPFYLGMTLHAKFVLFPGTTRKPVIGVRFVAGDALQLAFTQGMVEGTGKLGPHIGMATQAEIFLWFDQLRCQFGGMDVMAGHATDLGLRMVRVTIPGRHQGPVLGMAAGAKIFYHFGGGLADLVLCPTFRDMALARTMTGLALKIRNARGLGMQPGMKGFLHLVGVARKTNVFPHHSRSRSRRQDRRRGWRFAPSQMANGKDQENR